MAELDTNRKEMIVQSLQNAKILWEAILATLEYLANQENPADVLRKLKGAQELVGELGAEITILRREIFDEFGLLDEPAS